VRYTYAPAKTVLVALLRDKLDFKRAKDEHFYRMPVSSAPKRKAEYLALYQGRNFGAQGQRIEYYTRVHRYQVLKRRQILPDEPNHPRADKDYYRVELGPLCHLPHSILNTTARRILFFFTTLDRLLRAQDVNYLLGRQSIEELMWDELKRNLINASPQHYIFEAGSPIYRLDFAIFCLKGKINIECDGKAWHSSYQAQLADRERDNRLASRGWSVLRFSGREIYQDVKRCILVVKQTIATLGGQLE
jgi:very-short-patch-repair endonuclease